MNRLNSTAFCAISLWKDTYHSFLRLFWTGISDDKYRGRQRKRLSAFPSSFRRRSLCCPGRRQFSFWDDTIAQAKNCTALPLVNRSGKAVFISGSIGETTMTTLTFDDSSCHSVTADNYSVTTTCCAVFDHPVSDVLVTTGTGAVTVRSRIAGLVRRAVQFAKAGTRIAARWLGQQANSGIIIRRARTLGTRLTAAIKNHITPIGTRMKDRTRRIVQMARIRITLFLAVVLFHGIAARNKAARLWTQYKPVLVQAGRIVMVASVLYLFANAVLLTSCVIVAALGVHGYDRSMALLTQHASKRHRTGTPPALTAANC